MERGKKISQFDVFWVTLDPSEGSEMAKTRPCVIISPDEMNDSLRTVIIVPMTSTMWPIPSRVKVFFNGQYRMIALDQIRSVSKSRINDYSGRFKSTETQAIKDVLQDMFC